MSGRKSERRVASDRSRAEARQTRRSQFLDAALTTIRRDGPGASMEAIAAEAGITKPILYRYFDDRDGLIAALAERFGEQLVSHLRVDLPAGAEPREAMAGAIDAYISMIEQDPELYRFVTQRLPGGGDTITGVVDQVAAVLTTVIGETLRSMDADSGVAEVWAYSIVGMVHLAGDRWVTRPTVPRARLVEYLTNLLWEGIAGSSIRLVSDADARSELARQLGDDLADRRPPSTTAKLAGL